MNKKALSLISSIFLLVYSIFGFMPYIIQVNYHKAQTPGIGIYSLVCSYQFNLFYELTESLAIVLLVLAVIGIVVMICRCCGVNNLFFKIMSFVPIAMIVVFIILTFVVINTSTPIGEPAGTATMGYKGFVSHSLAWGYYIAAALLVTTGVLSFLSVFGKAKETHSTARHSSATQSVLQLKELLDAGAITQEEYDAKKKQLLEL